MKLALRALLVLVIAGVAMQVGAAAGGSTPLVTVPDSIVFWNVHDGLFAASQCPGQAVVCDRVVVELTTDGGRTSRVVFRTKQRSLSLQTVGAEGAIAGTANGKAWRTLNRGRTWQPFHSRFAVDWLNPQIGIRFHSYAAHSRGALAMFVTRDGGSTWERRSDPCKQAVSFSGFADLLTSQRWWIACIGEGAAGNENKAIYSTEDGGRTWKAGAASVLNSARGGVGSYGYPAGLAFAPDGWGLLTESRGTLYVTRDGGMHFRGEPHVARPETDFAGGAAAFSGGSGYVLLFDNPRSRLIETHDYGRSWQVVRRWG